MTRYIIRIHSARRARPSALSEQTWDEEPLKALFRLLERIMREAEGIVPFPADQKAAVHDQGSQKVKGRKKGVRGKVSKSPEIESPETNGSTQESLDEEVEQKGEHALSVIGAAAGAAECCLAILDGDGLSKPVSCSSCSKRSRSQKHS